MPCDAVHPEQPTVRCQLPADRTHATHCCGEEGWPNESYVAPPPRTTKRGRDRKLRDLAKTVEPEKRTPRSKAATRKSDPETSHEAAAKLGDLTEAQEEVLDLFRRHGPMMDEELVATAAREESKQTESGLRTRRSELVESGVLAWTGRFGQNSNENRSRIWGFPEASPEVEAVSALRDFG